MNKLVAVIGQRAPNVKGAPRVPGNEDQVSRSKLSEQAAFILRSSWQAEDRQPEVVYSLATKGTTFAYTPVVADHDKYGTLYNHRALQNMDLRACLYAHAQHPGFPQARVTNPDEPNGTCPTCGTIFGDGDPDEPVAGTG